MKIKSFDIGVERITQWDVGDEVHLPAEGKTAPAFLPQYRPLDAILRRPSLDERLPDLLQPTRLDPDLLEPSALSDTRTGLRRLFGRLALSERGRRGEVFAAAEQVLENDESLDGDVRAALAVLLRG